jgi:hypothetical protein
MLLSPRYVKVNGRKRLKSIKKLLRLGVRFLLQKKVTATMKSEDRALLETHLLAQITAIEQDITKLEAQRDTLRDLLFRARRENATLRDVTRKNSFDRILIEGKIVNLLKAATRPIPTQRLWLAAQEVNLRLRSATFRSYVHRLKSKGLIVSAGHGYWSAAEKKSDSAKSKTISGADNVPLPAEVD